MFKKLFGKKQPKMSKWEKNLRENMEDTANAPPVKVTDHRNSAGPAQSEPSPSERAMINTANEARANGETAKALQIAAKTLETNLLHVMKDERGVHVETALATLGALGGFWCLKHAVTLAIANPDLIKGTAEQQTQFIQVSTKDGRTFYFGDWINTPLFENEVSLWGLTGGMANHLGGTPLPDPNEIARHVSTSIGTPEFGIPRLPEGHPIAKQPEQLLLDYAKWTSDIIAPYTQDSLDFPAIAGFAIQNLMELGKGVIAPEKAAQIVMECAVPMAHIDPRRIEPPAA